MGAQAVEQPDRALGRPPRRCARAARRSARAARSRASSGARAGSCAVGETCGSSTIRPLDACRPPRSPARSHAASRASRARSRPSSAIASPTVAHGLGGQLDGRLVRLGRAACGEVVAQDAQQLVGALRQIPGRWDRGASPPPRHQRSTAPTAARPPTLSGPMRVQRPLFAGAGLEAHVPIVHGLGARRNEVRIPNRCDARPGPSDRRRRWRRPLAADGALCGRGPWP